MDEKICFGDKNKILEELKIGEHVIIYYSHETFNEGDLHKVLHLEDIGNDESVLTITKDSPLIRKAAGAVVGLTLDYLIILETLKPIPFTYVKYNVIIGFKKR